MLKKRRQIKVVMVIGGNRRIKQGNNVKILDPDKSVANKESPR